MLPDCGPRGVVEVEARRGLPWNGIPGVAADRVEEGPECSPRFPGRFLLSLVHTRCVRVLGAIADLGVVGWNVRHGDCDRVSLGTVVDGSGAQVKKFLDIPG